MENGRGWEMFGDDNGFGWERGLEAAVRVQLDLQFVC